MTSRQAHIPPDTCTPEQLRMAWPFFQGRYGCPDTLDAALQHRYYAPCIRALARTLHRVPMSTFNSGHHGAAAAAASRLGRETYVPPTPPAPPRVGRDGRALKSPDDPGAGVHTGSAGLIKHWMHRPAAHNQPRRLGADDAKRAAANDREDAAAA